VKIQKCQISATFCTKSARFLTTFVNFPLYFCKFLHHFFLAPFTQTTQATNQNLFAAQKQTSPREETEKTAISPQFLKFKKFHFSIMLICASLSTAISTVTKNRIFVLRQFKLADAPVVGQFNPNFPEFFEFCFLIEVFAYFSSRSFAV
ncbi:MAG: hypothetical protein OEW48_15395, partial [Phycisphaerae bacterium]|nr:hypothetical protein [Phycisphaerae bacterium]